MQEFSVKTDSRSQMIDVTSHIQNVVKQSGVKNGSVKVFIPHTTAGVTINENADPDVVHDMLMILDRIVPHEGGYHHAEGNSAAHVKSSMMGPSLDVIINDNRLVLGTWQGIYFCEFDGPRSRKVFVKVSRD